MVKSISQQNMNYPAASECCPEKKDMLKST